ncbi:hypothetical protein HYFRA_00003760 [Hymenoscyphus fraxineus]|uniref:Uncharacterized protein n=1 Tax=Hymenoscyphus fraxineus TaxID=746836 RepID=A0A9N9PV72_9HELO|nr:hypothetical protein HYFRA_00003760 [Hymenoscyphus fraxineus]
MTNAISVLVRLARFNVDAGECHVDHHKRNDKTLEEVDGLPLGTVELTAAAVGKVHIAFNKGGMGFPGIDAAVAAKKDHAVSHLCNLTSVAVADFDIASLV